LQGSPHDALRLAQYIVVSHQHLPHCPTLQFVVVLQFVSSFNQLNNVRAFARES
jgi:hypothetical protein